MMDLCKAIEESFSKIVKLSSEITLLEFSHTPKNDLEKYNFGLGTMIRLKLLRPKSTLYNTFIEYGYANRDEMAMVMIKAFHKSLRNSD